MLALWLSIRNSAEHVGKLILNICMDSVFLLLLTDVS